MTPEAPPSIVRSEPDYDEEPVIDLDYGFHSGAVKGFTLRPERGDVLRDQGDHYEIVIHDAAGKERLNVYKASLAWDSTRHRTIRTRRPGPPTASESPAPAV